MRSKIISALALALLISLAGLGGPALGNSYLVGGTYWDANKTAANPNDDLMCWAAAASNVLAWGGWTTPSYSTASSMFQNFQDHWTDAGSLMNYGWDWWLNGTLPPNQPGWSRVDVPGGGNYFPSQTFSNYFSQSWVGNTMGAVNSYLHSGKGVGLAIYKIIGTGGHALTAWGFEYNPAYDPSDYAHYYTGVWVTDSDDYQWYDPGLKRVNISWNGTGGYWALGTDNYGYTIYNGWYIEGVQSLGHVPLPSAIILLGSGLLGLLVRGRGKLARRN
jgi:hypothetical protein